MFNCSKSILLLDLNQTETNWYKKSMW